MSSNNTKRRTQTTGLRNRSEIVAKKYGSDTKSQAIVPGVQPANPHAASRNTILQRVSLRGSSRRWNAPEDQPGARWGNDGATLAGGKSNPRGAAGNAEQMNRSENNEGNYVNDAKRQSIVGGIQSGDPDTEPRNTVLQRVSLRGSSRARLAVGKGTAMGGGIGSSKNTPGDRAGARWGNDGATRARRDTEGNTERPKYNNAPDWTKPNPVQRPYMSKKSQCEYLIYAAQTGDLGKVRAQIISGTHVNNISTKDGRRALHWAAELGHLGIAQMLISSGASVNATDWTGETALHAAAKQHRPSMAKLLIDNGASVKAVSKDGLTTICKAANGGNADMLKLLLDEGATDMGNGASLLKQAASGGATAVAKLLIRNRASVGRINREGRTAALHAAIKGGHVDTVLLLIRCGASMTALDEDGKPPFSLAVESAVWEFDERNHAFDHHGDFFFDTFEGERDYELPDDEYDDDDDGDPMLTCLLLLRAMAARGLTAKLGDEDELWGVEKLWWELHELARLHRVAGGEFEAEENWDGELTGMRAALATMRHRANTNYYSKYQQPPVVEAWSFFGRRKRRWWQSQRP